MSLTSDLRARVEAHLMMWEMLGSQIGPIPADIVANTPFDSHVLGTPQEARLTAWTQRRPWASSGHCGKELNLMLAGYKRVALIDDADVSPWMPHIFDGRFVAVVDGFPGNYLVVQRAELRVLGQIIDAQMTDGAVGTGVTLGYRPEDIVRCAKGEQRQLALRGPITDEEHAQVMREAMANPRPHKAAAAYIEGHENG